MAFSQEGFPIFLDTYRYAQNTGRMPYNDLTILFGPLNLSAGAVLLVYNALTSRSLLTTLIGKVLSKLSVVMSVVILHILMPSFVSPSTLTTQVILKDSAKSCRRNWFSDLTFTANFNNPFEMCIFINWPNIMEPYMLLLFAIPLFVMSRNGYLRLGVGLTVAITVLSMFAHGFYLGFWVPSHFKTIITLGLPMSNIPERIWFLHLNPIIHVSTYGVGILIAGFLSSKNTVAMNLKSSVVTMASVIVMAIFIKAHLILSSDDDFFTRRNQVIIGCLVRPLICLCFWTLLINTSKKFPSFLAFCGHAFFTIGSRISLSLYIVHTLFVNLVQSQTSLPFIYSESKHLEMGLRVLTYSIIPAYLIAILLEYPVTNLVHYLLTKSTRNVKH